MTKETKQNNRIAQLFSEDRHPGRRTTDKPGLATNEDQDMSNYGRRKDDRLPNGGYNIGDVSIGDVGEGATVVIGSNPAPSSTSPESAPETEKENGDRTAEPTQDIIRHPTRLRSTERELPPELQRAVKSLHKFCMTLSRMD